jgi:hypothetical protein
MAVVANSPDELHGRFTREIEAIFDRLPVLWYPGAPNPSVCDSVVVEDGGERHWSVDFVNTEEVESIVSPGAWLW